MQLILERFFIVSLDIVKVFMIGTFFTVFVYFIWKCFVTITIIVYSVNLNLFSSSPIFAKCVNGNSPPLPPLKRTPGLQYRLLSLGTKSPRFERSQASPSTSLVSNISDQPETHFFTKEHMILVFETTQANRKYFVGQSISLAHPSDKNYDEE